MSFNGGLSLLLFLHHFFFCKMFTYKLVYLLVGIFSSNATRERERERESGLFCLFVIIRFVLVVVVVVVVVVVIPWFPVHGTFRVNFS